MRHWTWLLGAVFGLHLPIASAMVEFRGQTMGTTYAVKVRAPVKDHEKLQQDIDALLESVNDVASTYRPESEISRFNRLQTVGWFPASPRLLHWVERSLDVGSKSEGAFDLTIMMLVNLWGFGPKAVPIRTPSPADIQKALSLRTEQPIAVRSNPPAIKKARAEITIDLSAIAKGGGVDLLSELLANRGFADHFVEIGGEVRARGERAPGQPWRVAIEKPDSKGRSIQKVLGIRNVALATSGDYRNFFEMDGKRYSHIIDPRTGKPIDHSLVSVTVIAPTCEDADAYATAFMVLGYEKAADLAGRLGLEVFFIVREKAGFAERMSEGFQKLVVVP